MWICWCTVHQVEELAWGGHEKLDGSTRTHTHKQKHWVVACMSTHSEPRSLKSCFGGVFFKKRRPLTSKHWGVWSSTMEPALAAMMKSSTNTQHLEGLWWRELLWQPWTMRGRRTGEERRMQTQCDRAGHGQRLQNEMHPHDFLLCFNSDPESWSFQSGNFQNWKTSSHKNPTSSDLLQPSKKEISSCLPLLKTQKHAPSRHPDISGLRSVSRFLFRLLRARRTATHCFKVSTPLSNF